MPELLKNYSMCWRVGLLLIASFMANLVGASERTVTFVGEPLPPYVEGKMGEDAQSGIAVEIINQIFSKIDAVSARFPLIPWLRALHEVERGYHDGIALLQKTPEREVHMAYSLPLIVGANLVWSVRSTEGMVFEWDQFTDFHGKRIGIIRGYSYGEALEQAFKSEKIHAVSAPTVEHMFAMLESGRIDLALANDAVGAALVRKFPDAGITAASKPTDSDIFHLAISKKSPAVSLIPKINQIIMALKAEGFIRRMIRGG